MNKKVAYGLLVHADRRRVRKLIEDIENDFLNGNNNYPKTPMEAYNLLVNYRKYNSNRNAREGGLEQLAFIAEGKQTKPEGDYYPHIKRFKCRRNGTTRATAQGRMQINKSNHRHR